MSQILDVVKCVKSDADAVVEDTLTDLWIDLVDQTPVDTGAARSNWFMTSGSPSTRVNPRHTQPRIEYDRPETPRIKSKIPRQSLFFIANNSGYIEDLNNGSSRQNKQIGWVDAAVDRQVNRAR